MFVIKKDILKLCTTHESLFLSLIRNSQKLNTDILLCFINALYSHRHLPLILSLCHIWKLQIMYVLIYVHPN